VPASDRAARRRCWRPFAAARQAVIYRRFLDSIEPSERPYHRSDPQIWLERTAEILRSEPAE